MARFQWGFPPLDPQPLQFCNGQGMRNFNYMLQHLQNTNVIYDKYIILYAYIYIMCVLYIFIYVMYIYLHIHIYIYIYIHLYVEYMYM